MSIVPSPSLLRSPWQGVVVLAALTILSGCGDSSAGQSGAVEVPSKPSAVECGFRGTPEPARATGAGSEVKPPPAPGVYRYKVTGTQLVPGSGIRVKDLPPRGDLFVTRARRHGALTCFRAQRRYAPDIANTATYVIRGRDVYLVNLRIQALGESHEIRPDPPVLFLSDEGSSWSGQFGGQTSGSYEFLARGERSLRVSSQRLKVLGVSSVVSYRGAVNGTQRTTTWISPSRELVVSESLRSRQRFGVDSLRLRSRSRLLSLDPDPISSR